MIKVAINGFGRIGRLCFRLMEENEEFEVVAVNDLTDAEQLAYLLKYDTNHRNYRIDEIHAEGDYIVIGNRRVRVYAEKDPAAYSCRRTDDRMRGPVCSAADDGCGEFRRNRIRGDGDCGNGGIRRDGRGRRSAL